MDTPVRITSIGLASLGALWRKLTMGAGSSRWERSSPESLSSSARLGSRSFQSRKMTSSKLTFPANSLIS